MGSKHKTKKDSGNRFMAITSYNNTKSVDTKPEPEPGNGVFLGSYGIGIGIFKCVYDKENRKTGAYL